MNGAGDPLVVATDELAPLVNAWLAEFKANHPPELSGWALTQRTVLPMGHVSGIDLLGERTGLNQRALWRITRCESAFTMFGIADRILQAIERTEALYDGTVHVVPNPQWGRERWAAWQEAEQRSCEPL